MNNIENITNRVCCDCTVLLQYVLQHSVLSFLSYCLSHHRKSIASVLLVVMSDSVSVFFCVAHCIFWQRTQIAQSVVTASIKHQLLKFKYKGYLIKFNKSQENWLQKQIQSIKIRKNSHIKGLNFRNQPFLAANLCPRATSPADL